MKLKQKQARHKEFYKVGEKGLERIKKVCDRCGEGTFMADHKDRLYCGKCGMTVWKKSEKQEK